jgi:hypothetical protein
MTTTNPSAEPRAEHDSLYGCVMSNPSARDAYFNTTEAHLFAAPNEPSVTDIVELLGSKSLAFLFTSDEFLPHPVLQLESGQFVGEEEIVRAIEFFFHDRSTTPLAS